MDEMENGWETLYVRINGEVFKQSEKSILTRSNYRMKSKNISHKLSSFSKSKLDEEL